MKLQNNGTALSGAVNDYLRYEYWKRIRYASFGHIGLPVLYFFVFEKDFLYSPLPGTLLLSCFVLGFIRYGLSLMADKKINDVTRSYADDRLIKVSLSFVVFHAVLWAWFSYLVTANYGLSSTKAALVIFSLSVAFATAVFTLVPTPKTLVAYMVSVSSIVIPMFLREGASGDALTITWLFVIMAAFLYRQSKISLQNIIEIYLSQEEHQNENKKIQGVIDSMFGFVFTVTSDLKVGKTSSGIEEVLGLEFSAEKELEHVTSNRKIIDEIILFYALEKQLEAFEVQVENKSEKIWYLVNLKRTHTDLGIVVSGVNIDSFKNIQQDLALQKARAQHNSRMVLLSEMAAGIAHEINNPLTSVIGNASMLDHEMNSEEQIGPLMKKRVSKIISNANRIAKVVSGLKLFAKDGEKEAIENVKLESVVQEALGLCLQRFINSDIKVEVDNLPDLEIQCRHIQVAQALLNILTNAYDAVIEKDEKWIRISSKIDGDRVLVLVTDSGCGISKDLQSHLFNPFFSTKEVAVRSGLGLSVARSVIESNHGDLYYDATAKNTTFVIALPCNTLAQKQIA